MWAVLSDVHGNLEALEAVLEDIDRHRVARVLCLGDTVGYGPNPCECVDLIWQRCDVALLGNFDQAVVTDPEGFHCPPSCMVVWSAERLRERHSPSPNDLRNARMANLSALRPVHREPGALFVHASPGNHLVEYLFPEDIHNERKMARNFRLVERYCFHGHTHLPGVILDRTFANGYTYYSDKDVDYTHRLGDVKTLVNVGSVGQPRDDDWRACYVLLDGGMVRWRRVEYDIETTIRKIRDHPDFDDFQGDRLRDGR